MRDDLCGHHRDVNACPYCDDGVDVGDYWEMMRMVNARRRERQRKQARRAKASNAVPAGIYRGTEQCSHSLTFHDPDTGTRRCSFCKAVAS